MSDLPKRSRLPIFVALFVVLGGAWFVFNRPGKAPLPAAFAGGLTFEQGRAKASAENKLLVVVASADWCSPCQRYKREALADARVSEWLGANAVAVMLDVTNDNPEAAQLGISAIPVTLFFRNGTELSRREGLLGTEELLGWFGSASGQVVGAAR